MSAAPVTFVPPTLIDEHAVASMLNVSVHTLRSARCGRGPLRTLTWLKIGKHVWYRLDAIEQYLTDAVRTGEGV